MIQMQMRVHCLLLPIKSQTLTYPCLSQDEELRALHGRVAELTGAAEAAAPAAASAAAAAAEGMQRLRAELARTEAALQAARAQADQARHSQICTHMGSVPSVS